MYIKEKMISTIQKEFKKKRILVIGDLMVDEYITGKVSRISPEAPVPVLNYEKKSMEAGGASNVANNVRVLGGMVYVSGIAAQDDAGRWLRYHLKGKGIETTGIFEEKNRPTIVKKRYTTKNQQLLRMDLEITGDISIEVQQKIIDYICSHVEEFDAVILSDYRKAVLTEKEFVTKIIRICNQNDIFISIDSKSKNIEAFEGADFVKPNDRELEKASGIRITDGESLNEAGRIYLSKSKAKRLIVTRGAEGISIFLPDKKRMDFPTMATQVFDVTGAGDTVISTITMGMISGLDIEEAVMLANLAASVVIGKAGTVPIFQEELIERINEE